MNISFFLLSMFLLQVQVQEFIYVGVGQCQGNEIGVGGESFSLVRIITTDHHSGETLRVVEWRKSIKVHSDVL